MSDSHSHSSAAEGAREESHEGPIKTPKQLIWTVVAAFVVPVVIIILLVNFVVMQDKPAAGTAAFDEEAVARRIAPLARVELRDASDAGALKTGEQVYQTQCTACHSAGVAGAPRTGDAAAWAPRVKTGFEALLHAVLEGKNAMPAQGGGDFADIEIARAVVYLANKGGAKFDEPKAPAAAASAAASGPK